MNQGAETNDPQSGFGVAAVVMGAIALGLFALPVLGIPLAAGGLVCGIAALTASLPRGQAVRWPLLGILVTGMALSLGIAIGKAPSSFVPSPEPYVTEVPTGLPYVAPPARP